MNWTYPCLDGGKGVYMGGKGYSAPWNSELLHFSNLKLKSEEHKKIVCSTFSALWRLYRWTRATMTEVQMNNLSRMHTHPNRIAPDPIRVQSCACCLFWTNRNCAAVTSIFLSISLSNKRWILISALNSKYFYFYWNCRDGRYQG